MNIKLMISILNFLEILILFSEYYIYTVIICSIIIFTFYGVKSILFNDNMIDFMDNKKAYYR